MPLGLGSRVTVGSPAAWVVPPGAAGLTSDLAADRFG